MIEEIEKTGDADAYVRNVLDSNQRLMGFGHRVYRAEDPRARVLRRTAKELDAPRYEVAEALEAAALAELRRRRPDRVLRPTSNSGPRSCSTTRRCRRTCSRPCSPAPDWPAGAHILEQKRTGRLIRPSARYIGEGRVPQQVAGWDPLKVAPSGYVPADLDA